MDFFPKISIVIPVYNGSDYMREAIDSALAQTYSNIEVLVVNDGSTDDGETDLIAQSYGDRIRYFFKPNGGVASALNWAIKKMTGDFFSWLSHDDLYLKNKIEQEVIFISGLDHNKTIIYSDFSVFNSDPKKDLPVHLMGVSPEQFRYWITIENKLHGCTLLVPKAAFDECGNFNENLQTTQDYDLWFRMAEKYNFVHIPKVLVKARNHSGQGSIKMADTALKEINTLLSRFVSNLTANELAISTQQMPSIAYAVIAASMWHRGFNQAGQTAAQLSLNKMKQSSFWDTFSAIKILLGGALNYYTLWPIKTLFPPILRLKMKRSLQRMK